MKSLIVALVLVIGSQASAQATTTGFPGFNPNKGKPVTTGVPAIPKQPIVRGRPAPTGVPGSPIINPNLFAKLAKLTKLRIDREHAQGSEIESAQVEVNAVRKAVTLTLEPVQPCRPARVGQVTCMAMLPPIVIKLPLIQTKTDSCGSTVYVAKLDARPRDGALQVIEVTDNSTMTCEIFLAPDRVTEVEYTSEAARGGRNRSELSGGALVQRRF